SHTRYDWHVCWHGNRVGQRWNQKDTLRSAVSWRKLLDVGNRDCTEAAREAETDLAVRADLLPVQLGEDQQRTQGLSRSDRATNATEPARFTRHRRSSRLV